MTSKNESLNYIEWLQPDLGYGIWELKVVNVFLRLVWWYIVELSVNVDLFHFMVFSVLCLFMFILHMPLLEAMNINKSSIFTMSQGYKTFFMLNSTEQLIWSSSHH